MSNIPVKTLSVSQAQLSDVLFETVPITPPLTGDVSRALKPTKLPSVYKSLRAPADEQPLAQDKPEPSSPQKCPKTLTGFINTPSSQPCRPSGRNSINKESAHSKNFVRLRKRQERTRNEFFRFDGFETQPLAQEFQEMIEWITQNLVPVSSEYAGRPLFVVLQDLMDCLLTGDGERFTTLLGKDPSKSLLQDIPKPVQKVTETASFA
ncbi:hypothetical protein CYMTET_20407, partial [Cymbomonas tetramitiformis]